MSILFESLNRKCRVVKIITGNEAAIHTARRKGDTVDIKDFELASERIIGGN